MAFEITCYEGLRSITLSESDFPGLNDNTTIKELRDILVKKAFLKQNEEYKFARKQVLNEHATNPENLINLSLYAYADETDISIKRLYPENGKKRVQIANITDTPDLKKKPDYVGEYTTEWSKRIDSENGIDRFMKVQVQVNPRSENQPVMLSNVIKSSDGSDCYEYACICEEGCELSFRMGGAGACGNIYSVKILGGDQSLGSCMRISELDEGVYKMRYDTFDRWFAGSKIGKAIKMLSTDSMETTPDTKLQYRIINFQIDEVTEWYRKKEGNSKEVNYYSVESYPPPLHGFKGQGKTLSGSGASEGKPIIYNPGDVSGGTLTTGNDKGVNYCTAGCSKSKLYGVISAHFFVFKDIKIAEAYFKRYFG